MTEVNVMDIPVWGEVYLGSGRLTGKCDHAPHTEDERIWVEFDNLDQWYRQWRWDNHDMNHAPHCADWRCPYCVRDFLMPTRDTGK